ncbi:sugar porter family MFS transporter [Franconibacter sp. IITDAS19]|uniref:sugar porter family MFS transporter n=1 Tax=Franconibacter sp. IITDAS19 TaxID=2930569 RepID=UPI001FF95E00|nr:sugar porter family MFS transporter [Franconibacter sp. IITDAS19]MCK1967639.1 sugar porter family MFS transporter [Franconibacter sp. IITDAS19]
METNDYDKETPEQASGDSVRQRLFFVVLVATMGSLAYGYDTGIISGALPFMTLPAAQGGLGLNPFTEGLVTSSLIFGAALGAFLSGYLSDRFGRRITLRSLALLFVLGALGTALAPTVNIMIVMRFLLGVAVGGGSSTVPVFIAEIAGPRKRAPLVSRNELMIVSGQLVAYIVSALMSYLLNDPHLWRYMLALAMVPGVLLFIGTFFVPASPHWLVAEGRVKDALRVLKTLREHPREVQKEMSDMKQQARESQQGPSTKELLKQKWVLRLVLTGAGMGFVLQFTGVNAFMYYTPIILKTTGMGTSASIAATIGNGIVSVLAAIAGIKGVSRFGRRPMLMTGLTIVICAQIALGCVLVFMPQDMTQSLLALGCILVFLFFMQMCISPVYWLLMSELFPMKVRGALTGTAVSFQWICNAIVAFAFPPLLAVAGNTTFFIFALINIGSLIFVAMALPETRGKSLEQIETAMRQRFGEQERAAAGETA